MTIIRVLVIFLLFWLIFRIIRIKMAKRTVVSKKAPKIVDVKQCHYCQVHIPEKEALKSGSKFYCSSEHLKLDSQNNKS
ncbi:MAG: PP0621 family protein [Gammaproteobacteria bacterium]